MNEKEKIYDQLNKVSGGGRGAKSARSKDKPNGFDDFDFDKANENKEKNLHKVAHKSQTAAAKTGNQYQYDRFNATDTSRR